MSIHDSGWTLFTLLAGFLPQQATAEAFNTYWYDGNAEISVYKLHENRYNEIRTGQRIMVFVTEPLRRSMLIKPDSILRENERFDVIKLNDIRKFTTGIYDYSVMTSVFTAVKNYDGVPAMSALKISFGSQEWCGNVFEIMKRDKVSHVRLFSYFESDGEPEHVLNTSEDFIFEDNLWIRVRELTETFVKEGHRKRFF